jgi:hypothetical protein
MALYWILLAIDGAAALVALYFFFIGLADGSVSSFNAGIWLALLGGLGAVIGGGMALNASGRRRTACALLSVLGCSRTGAEQGRPIAPLCQNKRADRPRSGSARVSRPVASAQRDRKPAQIGVGQEPHLPAG